MFVERIASEFRSFAARYDRSDILFGERYPREHDQRNDYNVIYEAYFEPASESKARIEFWVTDSDCLAVGIETYQRVNARTGKGSFRQGFAAGHEPRKVSEDYTSLLLKIVEEGAIAITPRYFLGRILSARLYVHYSEFHEVVKRDNRADWLSPIEDLQSSSVGRHVLRYRPWIS